MERLKEGDELPRTEISPEAKTLAERLHHEARTERIFTIIELALRDARNRMLDSIRASLAGYPHMGGDIEIMQEVDRIKNEARDVKGFSIRHWPKENETPNLDSESKSNPDV
jgi:hypothetical protein